MHSNQRWGGRDNAWVCCLGLFIVVLICFAGAASSGGQADGAASASSQPDGGTAVANAGMEVLNAYRAMAKLPPLKEASALSQGDRDHAIYLVKNYGEQIRKNQNLGVNFHLEETNRPSYTYAGFVAGRSSDVVTWSGKETRQAASSAIDGWFVAPFHRFPLLSTHLEEAGYGEYCEAGACAAALNITTGGVSPSLAFHRRIVASGSYTSQQYGSTVLDTPIEFPPDGSTVRLREFHGRMAGPTDFVRRIQAANRFADQCPARLMGEGNRLRRVGQRQRYSNPDLRHRFLQLHQSRKQDTGNRPKRTVRNSAR